MPRENQDRDAIVSKAIGIASEEERAAYITQASDGNDELKHQVEERVAAHFRDHSHGRASPPAGNCKPSPESSKEQSGANHAEDRELRITGVGPYKIVKRVGAGTSGVVFLAEQQEPVQLKTALKVIKHGLDWRQVAARFEAERQVLSRMEHPNIAKVIGAGTRQSGQPYFVMELVEGLPLTKYCDEHKVSLQQRLEFFISVCQAVQFAHQKGVIHGDLKPSNVLVTNQNGKPTPKILDFGVAKAVRRLPSDNAPSTGSEVLGDKPEYLSPEQTEANDPDIDTRSDVYSLGVFLHELVTGTTPLTEERLRDVSMTETLRSIREEEVAPPSTRLNESKDRLASVAAKRQMKPDALVKAVTGDLDCVVTKALQKDRTRRYQTVHELARDLQRYLAKEPVEACPHATTSRLRTLARQHPRAAMKAAGMLLFLFLAAVGGAGLGVWEWREAKQARELEQKVVEKSEKAEEAAEKAKGKLKRAIDVGKERVRERDQAQKGEKAARRSEEEMKAILSFIEQKLLSTSRPGVISLSKAFWSGTEESQGQTVRKGITLRQAVDEAEGQVAKTFAVRPQAEAAVREMLGLTYVNLGEAAQAVRQYERALALREAMQGVNNPETSECLNELAVAYRLAGRDADAARLYHRDPNSPANATALAIQGMAMLSQRKFAEAEPTLRQCLTIREKNQPDDWTTFDTRSMLGEALLEQKKYPEAEPLLLSGYKGLKNGEADIPSQEKGRLTRALERLVKLYEAWGKKEEAVKWRKELESMEKSTPPKSPD
jgi:serine/threonine protein kinase